VHAARSLEQAWLWSITARIPNPIGAPTNGHAATFEEAKLGCQAQCQSATSAGRHGFTPTEALMAAAGTLRPMTCSAKKMVLQDAERDELVRAIREDRPRPDAPKWQMFRAPRFFGLRAITIR
jgi:hypothetical protein